MHDHFEKYSNDFYEFLLLDVLSKIYLAKKQSNTSKVGEFSNLLLDKFAIHSASFFHLSNGIIELKKSNEKVRMTGYDLFTVNATFRSIMESYATFNNLFVEPKTANEEEFRFLLWKLDGLYDKQSFDIGENDFPEAKEILEKDLQLQKEKVKNLHLNLNLRTETQKAFLENLKKIKKTKNIEPEEILRDLQFKINNLIQLDNKDNELINESSLENKLFMDKLSENFPILSHQELKLCVYFKLNLSGKEIAILEKFTVGSIRVYKAKIKSKMGLSKEENLNDFLNTI